MPSAAQVTAMAHIDQAAALLSAACQKIFSY